MGGRPAWPNAQDVVTRRANSIYEIMEIALICGNVFRHRDGLPDEMLERAASAEASVHFGTLHSPLASMPVATQ
jgi:hypothetical protein